MHANIGNLMAVFGVYLILGTGNSFNLPGILMSLLSVLLWSLVSVLTFSGIRNSQRSRQATVRRSTRFSR